jgi:UDP-MurNAc hydroxylase
MIELGTIPSSMRLTVLGHSALYVETGGPTLLVDPWLGGSCYWRSWWHFPPMPPPAPAVLAPDYLYLSHHHFDHFHYPTLRRLDRRTHVLVPKFGVDVMASELRALGFGRVTELPHGQVVELAPRLRVASYQYGSDDSLLAIDADGEVIFDVNDCKIRGHPGELPLRQFGSPTFMLKSHSWAQGYPNCYEADDPADLRIMSRESFVEDFIDAVRRFRPRYAVPFASMVAFLHPETIHLNDPVVTPIDVRSAFERADGVDGTDLVLMAPADSWDSEHGFELRGIDWYSDRSRHITELAESVRPAVDEALAEEAARTLRYERFADYFTSFLRALPALPLMLLFRRNVVFDVPDAGRERYWVLDFRHRAVQRSSRLPQGHAAVIRVPAGVLADAIDKRIVNFVHISMRFRVRLRRGGTREGFAFWGLLELFELGYLPLRKSLTPRAASVLWARRAELLEMAGNLTRRGGFAQRLRRSYAAPGTRLPPDHDDTCSTPAAGCSPPRRWSG